MNLLSLFYIYFPQFINDPKEIQYVEYGLKYFLGEYFITENLNKTITHT